MPTAGTQSEGSQDGNADAASQASGDASSVTSRPEEQRAGTAGSVTADDETVQEATGAHGNTAHREAPLTHPRVQVSSFELTAYVRAQLTSAPSVHVGTRNQ